MKAQRQPLWRVDGQREQQPAYARDRVEHDIACLPGPDRNEPLEPLVECTGNRAGNRRQNHQRHITRRAPDAVEQIPEHAVFDKVENLSDEERTDEDVTCRDDYRDGQQRVSSKIAMPDACDSVEHGHTRRHDGRADRNNSELRRPCRTYCGEHLLGVWCRKDDRRREHHSNGKRLAHRGESYLVAEGDAIR